MGRMNPTFNRPIEPHLWSVGNIPPNTWENCRDVSKRIARTHSYDNWIHLLIKSPWRGRTTVTWTTTCTSMWKAGPLLRRILGASRLNPGLTLVRAEVDS